MQLKAKTAGGTIVREEDISKTYKTDFSILHCSNFPV